MSSKQEQVILSKLEDVFTEESEADSNLLSLLAELPYRPPGQMIWFIRESPDPIPDFQC
jgi:hypothetical protein